MARSKAGTTMLIVGGASLVPIVAMVAWTLNDERERSAAAEERRSQSSTSTSAEEPEAPPPPPSARWFRGAPTATFGGPAAAPTEASEPTAEPDAGPDILAEVRERPEDHPTVQGCNRHEEQQCEYAGQNYRWGRSGFPKEPETARTYFERGCDYGHAQSCVQLAFMLQKGEGGEADEDKAEKLFFRTAELNQKGCDDGDAMACVRLADAYRHGRGVDKDEERAQEIMEEAVPELDDLRERVRQKRAEAEEGG